MFIPIMFDDQTGFYVKEEGGVICCIANCDKNNFKLVSQISSYFIQRITDLICGL